MAPTSTRLPLPVSAACLGTLVCGLGAAVAVGAADPTWTGRFRPAEVAGHGSVTIRRENGRPLLRLSQDFRTSESAPDLKVVLSRSATPLVGSRPPAYPLRPGSFTVLAPLRATRGSQTYVIPASVDLGAQRSVLIWCEKFNATMAWAPLERG